MDPGSGGDPGVDGGQVQPATCTGKAAMSGTSTWSVMGRDVRVHVPASYDPGAATPIVINLHGLADSGAGQADLTHMDDVADANGFVALYPDGTGSPLGWNGGACCNPASASGVDDVAFVSAVIDEAESRLCVDDDRVFAAGFSNGAFLAHRLACELADRVAAIGAVSGVVGIPECESSRPIAVIDVHGTSDLVIPFGGGGINGNESVDTTIDRWVTRDGCASDTSTVYDHGDATCVSHGGCTGGTEVELCTIDGGGHQWPGGKDLGFLNGKRSTDLDASAAIWAFLAAHPR
jgi:polyhydroxybutyrate depolymerase